MYILIIPAYSRDPLGHSSALRDVEQPHQQKSSDIYSCRSQKRLHDVHFKAIG